MFGQHDRIAADAAAIIPDGPLEIGGPCAVRRLSEVLCSNPTRSNHICWPRENLPRPPPQLDQAERAADDVRPGNSARSRSCSAEFGALSIRRSGRRSRAWHGVAAGVSGSRDSSGRADDVSGDRRSGSRPARRRTDLLKRAAARKLPENSRRSVTHRPRPQPPRDVAELQSRWHANCNDRPGPNRVDGAMHIPDGYLSPDVCAATGTLAAVAVGCSIYKLRDGWPTASCR